MPEEKAYTGSGYLSIRALLGGAFPIEGAVVRIIGADEVNSKTSFSVLTDRDGITEKIMLPAPPLSSSIVPNPSENPYALYDVEITKEGFYPRKFQSITVFSGVETVQNINMIPINPYNDTLPKDTVNVIIPNIEMR